MNYFEPLLYSKWGLLLLAAGFAVLGAFTIRTVIDVSIRACRGQFTFPYIQSLGLRFLLYCYLSTVVVGFTMPWALLILMSGLGLGKFLPLVPIGHAIAKLSFVLPLLAAIGLPLWVAVLFINDIRKMDF